MKITGYHYGPYFFNVLPSGKICGLSNVKYDNEADLVREWDNCHSGYVTAPKLTRVSDDGTEYTIRPIGKIG